MIISLVIQKILSSIDVQFIIVFGVLIILDWITGVLKAIKTHTLSSEIGIRGILSKLAILLGVIAFCIANQLYLSVDWLETFFKIALIFYEVTSIFENLTVIEPRQKQLFAYISSILAQRIQKENKAKGISDANRSETESSEHHR